MAEQVNQRIEDTINELEQMRRTNLFNDEEIKDIARKRREFEYKVQRKVKQKDDYVQYIAYELALLEDVSLRRKQAKLGEKKKDMEYAIAKRLNKLFKQFIYRFQNEVEVYFEYIKFCMSVNFIDAISGIIGQMLQMHGDKPKMWLMASMWESKEQNNLENAKSFLLKGIHRHPKSEILYLELFEIELMLAFKAESEDDKEKQLQRLSVVWKNAAKNITDVTFLLKLCDLSMKYNSEEVTKDLKQEIWLNCDKKEVWSYIAAKELEGNHWEEIEEFSKDQTYSQELNYCIGVYEEALRKFSDEKLYTQYIHTLLGVSSSICTEVQKITAVKRAWMSGMEKGLLSDDMFTFAFETLKLENKLSKDELYQILDSAPKKNLQSCYIWEQKLLLCKSDGDMLSTLNKASKELTSEDLQRLWNFLLDNVDNNATLTIVYKKLQNCHSSALLAIKPKLLEKLYKLNGLKAARGLYKEFIRTPPMQMNVHTVMIEIEKSVEKPNLKSIRKCYECAVQHHGTDKPELWMDFISFETENGNAQAVPALYRRAISTLKKDLVDEFIKAQTLAKIK